MIAALATLAFELVPIRPPAVPLVVHSPYVSAWSMSDKLTDRWPQHWSGGNNAMLGMVRVDGKPYRFMGPQPWGIADVPALEQTSVQVTATRSVYTFEGAGIRLEVEFCSPLLSDDLELLARPVTYVTLRSSATDGKEHRVEAYLDWSGEWVVEDASKPVEASRYRLGGRDVLSLKASGARPLARSGDRVRIDWGSLYVAAPGEGSIAGHHVSRGSFVEGKPLAGDDMRFPRPASDDWPVIGFRFPLQGAATVAIGFDEGFAVEYLRRPLRPYWNRQEIGFGAMFSRALAEAESVRARAAAFDEKLHRMMEAAGGPEYAALGHLAYRQCLAGHGLAQDIDGDLLMFSKENTSNGCIATVDVTFPASPFFLLLNPDLLKAQLRPILEYASSPRWRFPFAPHDLGTYPLANGQVYGGGETDERDQMPVEESANMLLMIAALARTDGNADFARPFAPVLVKWAGYLREKGLDPEEQLCTDDFTGHLAHNANLSIKAILALRAYADLQNQMGGSGAKDAELAQAWANEWQTKAAGEGLTRLAFDRPGTWSQKYNLFWDRYLGYRLFPDSLIQSELKGYAAKANRYGFPLDNRAQFTKTDWLIWSASLSESKERFREFVLPVYRFVNETPSRVPFTDWYETVSGETRGMHTRTVIGGIFARALLDKAKT